MDTGGLSEVAAEDLNMGVDTSSHLDVEAMSSVPWWWSVNASLEQVFWHLNLSCNGYLVYYYQQKAGAILALELYKNPQCHGQHLN